LSVWFYGGADYERQSLPAHRSVPVPTTSRSRSAHALLTCSADHSYTRRISRHIHRVAQKSKPLPNYQKIVLHRIKVCQWD